MSRLGASFYSVASARVSREWLPHLLIQCHFKIKMQRTVALQHHYAVVNGLHPMTMAMGPQPATAVAQLLPVASKRNAVVIKLLKIHGDPVHLPGIC